MRELWCNGFTFLEHCIVLECNDTFSSEGSKKMINEVVASVFTFEAHKHVIVVPPLVDLIRAEEEEILLVLLWMILILLQDIFFFFFVVFGVGTPDLIYIMDCPYQLS